MHDSSSFINTVELLTGGLSDLRLRRLFMLSSLGQYGPFGQSWISSFKELGVLHLLVLSGSQISHLQKSMDLLLARVVGPFSTTTRTALHRSLLLYVLILFINATGCDPPIVRAGFFVGISMLLPNLRWPVLALLTLVLQASLFPSHLAKLGFYLSWVASLLLMWTRSLGFSKALQMCWVSFACQGLVEILKKTPFSFWDYLCGLLANFVMGCLFDSLIMPLSGLLIALGMALSHIPLQFGFWPQQLLGLGLAPFLSGSGELILVAQSAIRYIYSL